MISNNEQLSRLNSISEHLLLTIMKFLPPIDILNLMSTCSNIHKKGMSNLLWSTIYQSEYKIEQNNITNIYPPYFFYSQYILQKKILKLWSHTRPITTTISNTSCITCLHLNKNNELIFSDTNGSAGLFRIYPYHSIAIDELYMQHHKQTKICERLNTFYGHCGAIWSIDRHESILFTGSYDKTIKLWDSKSGNCLDTLRGHLNWVSCVKYNSFYNKLISASWDSTIRVWNLNTKQTEKIFNEENGNYIYCISQQEKEGVIFAGTEKKEICIKNLNKYEQKLNSLIGHSGRINCIDCCGDLLFSGSEDKIGIIWDLREGKEVNKLIGHLRGITQIIYDDVSNRIYSSSCDKTINIWDIRMCKKIRSLIGHSSSVYSIAVDQNKLISGSRDNSIRIWHFIT